MNKSTGNTVIQFNIHIGKYILINIDEIMSKDVIKFIKEYSQFLTRLYDITWFGAVYA